MGLELKQATVESDCDICGGPLYWVHEPEGSRRLRQVYSCGGCGLAQSLPRSDDAPQKPVAVSGGADWGNVRYGKGFRTQAALDILRELVDPSQIRSILDVGANRGSFVLECVEAFAGASITALEPDVRVTGAYEEHAIIETVVGRIESVELGQRTYDLIYCSHTLEHVPSARKAVEIMAGLLDEGGVFYLEVPNVRAVSQPDMICEFFIDKHLYHFDLRTLLRCVSDLPFEVLFTEESMENLVLVLRKTAGDGRLELDEFSAGPSDVAAMIKEYSTRTARNRAELRSAIAALPIEEWDQVAVWGAGRIFDVAVRFGGLQPDKLIAVVDKYLHQFVEDRFGVPLYEPSRLQLIKPRYVLICSREYAEEIEEEVRSLVPESTPVKFFG